MTREFEEPTKEAMQMTAEHQTAGAASHAEKGWHTINWQTVNQEVRRLQVRIVKAQQQGRWGKVKALQHLLTHSFSGKALAVKRVTENQGKRTPGVDGELWKTPQKKAEAVETLKQRGYRPRPLRRIYIPKSSGKMRPLGIPTMKDRAMQALYPAFPRSHSRNPGGPELVWVQKGTLNGGRHRSMPYGIKQQSRSRMDIRGGH
jgi:RNA-directed DNA polymerase